MAFGVFDDDGGVMELEDLTDEELRAIITERDCRNDGGTSYEELAHIKNA
jgi:hypothetical protein